MVIGADDHVTARTVVWQFLEHLRFAFVSVLHRLQGGGAAQGCLRQPLVVKPNVAMECGLQFLAGSEMMALQYVFHTTIEPLDPLPGRCLLAITESRAVGLQ